MRSEAHWLPRWNGTWINQVMACSPAAEPCVRRCKAYLASQLFCKLGWRGCGNSGTGLYQLAEVCGRCTKRSGLITTKHAHVSSATRDVCRKKKKQGKLCFVLLFPLRPGQLFFKTSDECARYANQNKTKTRPKVQVLLGRNHRSVPVPDRLRLFSVIQLIGHFAGVHFHPHWRMTILSWSSFPRLSALDINYQIQ